ncbi:MAG TPA: hypothetical protein P5117_16430, partial [Spirochaetia bacterium]|nr:hypothetical protein [Spirochaetia bacterium]
MTRYADHDMTEEELRHLDDEGADVERKDSRPSQSLPWPLYRLAIEHSHETFLAVYDGPVPQPPELSPAVPVPEVPDLTAPPVAEAAGSAEGRDAPESPPESPAAQVSGTPAESAEPEAPAPAPRILAVGSYVLVSTRYGRDL